MLTLIPALLLAQVAGAATPAHWPAPIVTLSWTGSPDGFHVTSARSEWTWVESATFDIAPGAAVQTTVIVHLPAEWEYRRATAAPAQGVWVSHVGKVADHPGDWRIEAQQDVMAGTASLEFLDGRDRVHTLTVRLRSTNRTPYVLSRSQCEHIAVRLDPRVKVARYLFLVVDCFEHGAESASLAIARSPDGRWVASPEIKDVKAPRFEFAFAKRPPKSSHEKLFTLYTEDTEGRRAEWSVVTTEGGTP